jgi:hypothetical protein
MKWITRERVKVDRVACPWLIKHFVDEDAEFVFVPPDKVVDEAKRLDAIPYDVKNVELGHHGKECSFEAILKKYKLTDNRALVLLGKIVNGADTDNTLYQQPEGPGLEAVAEGFRHLDYKDDHALNAAEWIVYDALYAYCQEMVRQGKSDGMFATRRSFVDLYFAGRSPGAFAANETGARRRMLRAGSAQLCETALHRVCRKT